MITSWACWWNQPWAGVWAATLLHFLWQGIVIAAGHGVCLMMLRGAQAQWRYLSGLGWLFVLACCPLVTCFLLIATHVDVASFNTAGTWAETPVATESVEPVLVENTHVAWRLERLPSASWSAGFRRVSIDWQRWMVGGWSLGVATLSLRLIGGGCLVFWLRRHTEAIPPELAHQVQVFIRRLRISGAVVVAFSSRATTAFACGLWRPMVLLPASWLVDMSPAMLQAVLAHELAHIRRYDLWVNLLQRVTETLWFYHPGVWWISMSIRRERETACDELAVSILPSRVHYAETLEFLAERRLAGTAPLWLSAGIGGRRMVLLQRIQHILGTSSPRTSGGWLPTLSVVVLLTAGTAAVVRSAAVAASQDPQSNEIVTETDEADSGDAEQRRDELRAVQRELRQAQGRLREYERVIEELRRELDAMRARFARQQERVESLARQRGEASGADTRALQPRERDAERRMSERTRQEYESLLQAERQDTIERSIRRERDRARDRERAAEAAAMREPREAERARVKRLMLNGTEAAAMREPREAAAVREFERRMLDHRQESIQMQMQQAKERFAKELELRRREIKSSIGRRKQQFQIQQEMAELELKQQALQHERQAREISRRMEAMKQRIAETPDGRERDQLEREMETLRDEQELIKAEQEIARARGELEVRARQADVESELEAALKTTEMEAELQLQSELRNLEMEQRELELERQRLQLQADSDHSDGDGGPR